MHADLLTFRLHHIAKRAGERVSTMCSQSFALSRRQLRVLSMLSGQVARSPSELAQAAAVDRGRMSRTLDQLERRGFVERRSVAGDARRQLVTLTPAGERLYDNLFGQVKDINRFLLAPLSPADVDALERILDALESQLGLAGPPG